ncbi:MAG: hypothetical protein IK151_01755 [Erysipelotrichaceae bacterium]|nr:hypothetical protein [Erysipelotrichaceae bacterium]
MFNIKLGIPEMEELWSSLTKKVKNGSAKKNEVKLYKQMGKTMKLLSNNPKYPGLNSHDIEQLSARYGQKVFESYLENNTPGAGRIFWIYGPNKKDITIIGLEPHPNDKSNAYKKITLSSSGKQIG